MTDSTSGHTRLHWGRIVLAALLLEALLIAVLIPIGEIGGSPFALNEASRLRDPTIFFVSVPIACFVLGYVVTMWVVRKLAARFMLHGALIGVLATVLYLGMAGAQPGGLGAVSAAYGDVLFSLVQGLRIAGCVAGGAHVARSKRRQTPVHVHSRSRARVP